MSKKEETLRNIYSSIEFSEIASGLRELQHAQTIVSGLVSGGINKNPKNSDITSVAFALIGEIFEATQEVGWKSWKENGEINDEKLEKVIGEFGDVLAFLGLYLVHIENRFGITPKILAAGYEQTCAKNVNRFFGESGEAGYKNIAEENSTGDL